MTATAEAAHTVEVPLKCAPTPGAGVPANPCVVPGSTLRCQLCPQSPTYWRREVSP